MRDTRISERVLPWGPRSRSLRRLRSPASALTAFAALLSMSLMAGPARGVTPADPCSLPRTGAHHSVGLDSWNTAYPRPDRTLDAVMVFLSFPDSTPRVGPAELAADYFPAAPRFFDRASYGKLRLRPHPVPRWIEMPAASGSYGIRRDWDSRLRTAYLHDAVRAADPVVDFSRYDIVYLVADPDAPGVDSDATKVVNFELPMEADGSRIRRIVTLFEDRPPDRHVLAHETGHVFDLPDLYHRPEAGAADWDRFVGDWDLMGSQFGLAPEPFGWHKWKLGWLDRSRIVCVEGPGATQHLVQPLEKPLRSRVSSLRPGATAVSAPPDTRLLVVPLGPTEALVLEGRGRYGNDSEVCRTGILLYRVRSDVPSVEGPIRVVDTHPATAACHQRSVHPQLADAPLRPGETFTLDVGGGVRVAVGERQASGGWPVRIVRG